MSLVTSIDDLFIKYEKVYCRSCGTAFKMRLQDPEKG